MAASPLQHPLFIQTFTLSMCSVFVTRKYDIYLDWAIETSETMQFTSIHCIEIPERSREALLIVPGIHHVLCAFHITAMCKAGVYTGSVLALANSLYEDICATSLYVRTIIVMDVLSLGRKCDQYTPRASSLISLTLSPPDQFIPVIHTLS